MRSHTPARRWRAALVATLAAVTLLLSFQSTALLTARSALAAPQDGTFQSLPYSQAWTTISLLNTTDDWSTVPGVIGYRGDGLAAASGIDPQTILADGSATPLDVNVNQTNPDTFTTGGVTEFHLANPVVALAGSATARAPHLVLHLSTTGLGNITVAYNLRDIDGSADNATQPVALQYRVGTVGNYTNVPAAFVADASSGPSQATLVTPVSVVLPPTVNNQSQLQLRIMTTDAAGGDEWIGIDDISVTGTPVSTPVPDLNVSKSGPATALPNSVITYTIAVNNQGTAAAAGVRITDTLPSQMTYLSHSSSTPLTFTNSSPTLLWQAGTVLTGTNITIALRVQLSPLFSQTITNTVRASTTTTGDSPANNSDSAATAPPAGGTCGQSSTPIYQIQGTGSASPFPNSTAVTVEGVVTGDFQGTATGLGGFFLQDPTGDGNAASSDGIFVFESTGTNVTVGQRVRVSGQVQEFTAGSGTLTQISSVTTILDCGPATPITPVAIDLPIASLTEWEQYEGMLVTFPETLTATETFTLGRFGEVHVAADGRLFQPTNFNPPGAGIPAIQNLNDRRRILIDDGSNVQNPPVVPYLAADNTLREGDTTANLTGILSFGFSNYRLQPTQSVTFTRVNDRTPNPNEVGGTAKVASFNVLNYFTTIDNGSNGARGADSATEFTRQRTKIIAAMGGLNADILGLIELENNGAALQDLVSGLNAVSSSPYAIAPGYPDTIGTDVIKVGIIYRPSVVTPVGTVFVDNDPINNRPTVAQTFEQSGQRFTVIINHFKSKSCSGATGADTDQGDGQSCYNATRVQQAQRLLAFMSTIQAATGDSDFIILGDLNAYSEEDPITTLEAGGMHDLSPLFQPVAEQYSYVFGGQSGELDHAMVSTSLLAQVSGFTVWHINSDEPIDLDYNDDVLTSGEGNSEYNQPYLYQPNGYRSSDHDPALAGLEFMPTYAQFSLPDYQVIEGNTSLPITVTLTQATDITFTIPYSSTDGTALGGLDYTPVSGTLTFSPRQTQTTFLVPILDDGLVEPSETVNLQLTNSVPFQRGIRETATITIIDNDVPTAVTVGDLGTPTATPLPWVALVGLLLGGVVGLALMRRR